MADSAKAEKIAAARKKLKQFQSKTTKTDTVPTSISTTSTINETLMDTFQLNDSKGKAIYDQITGTVPTTINSFPQNNDVMATTDSSTALKTFDHFKFNNNLFNIRNNNDNNHINVDDNSQMIQSSGNFPSDNSENASASKYFMEQFNAGINGVFDAIISSSTVSDQQEQQSQQQQQSPNQLTIADGNNQNNIERINELENLLKINNLENQSLNVQLNQQNGIIESLQNELITLKSHSNLNNAPIIDKLRTDLQAHTQTVNILVGEKTDLSTKLINQQQQINEYEQANIELQARLNASRHRVIELERDLNTLKQTKLKYDGSQQALCTELEQLQDENKRLKRLYQEACDETAEVQHQFSLKSTEIDNLKKSIDEKVKDIEILQLRIEQLTAGDLIRHEVNANAIDNQSQQFNQNEYERQIIELQNTISELSGDRDRLQQQYQTYVQHLTKESTTLQQRIQELTETNEKLTKREESLVNHVSDLERQFQKQLSTQQRLSALRDDSDHKNETNDTNANENDLNKELKEHLKALEQEKSDLNNIIEDNNKQNELLKQQLLDKDEKIVNFESLVERLRIETPDTSTILATIESDKVAASRAVSQNQDLKDQLDEIQKAYVQVSNDKFDLISRLQTEQHLAREIKTRFADIENELKTVKETLHFKDEEMIRLAHENTELHKEILSLIQELDLSNHRNATNNDNIVSALQQQLTTAKSELKRMNSKLKKIERSQCDESNEKTTTETIESTDEPLQTENDLNGDHSSHEHILNAPPIDISDTTSICSTINIATNEALEKLQDRFRRTMDEIADLTEEKQRLEHLVLQLQSETETIGEYIALYQTQRRLLKQRELEKDIQLHRIANDRTEMKDKLRQLNKLVELLLIQKGFTNAQQIMEKLNATNEHEHYDEQETIDNNIEKHSNHENEMVNKTIDENLSIISNTENNLIENGVNENVNDDLNVRTENEHNYLEDMQQLAKTTDSHQTAEKIINLLTEIKEKNLNQDYISVPNSIHHCPCCSGKLEIV